MKKYLFLSFILSALISINVYAQGPSATEAPDPATMLQQMKEKFKSPMIEKTGLTESQADKVIEINFELRQSMMTDMRDLNEADRTKRIAEFKAAKEKRYSEIPLTPEQIKAVYAFYEGMGKSRHQKGGK